MQKRWCLVKALCTPKPTIKISTFSEPMCVKDEKKQNTWNSKKKKGFISGAEKAEPDPENTYKYRYTQYRRYFFYRLPQLKRLLQQESEEKAKPKIYEWTQIRPTWNWKATIVREKSHPLSFLFCFIYNKEILLLYIFLGFA